MQTDCMIAFLPTSAPWVDGDFPHMTLVYGGPIADRTESDFNAMTKDAITASRVTRRFSLMCMGVEVFGPDDDRVDVLTLYPTPELLVARRVVERWNSSEYGFKPHITLGPTGFERRNTWNLPTRIQFDSVVVAWGDKKTTFDLDGYPIDY